MFLSIKVASAVSSAASFAYGPVPCPRINAGFNADNASITRDNPSYSTRSLASSGPSNVVPPERASLSTTAASPRINPELVDCHGTSGRSASTRKLSKFSWFEHARMSAASTNTSFTAPDVNNARAAYNACTPEAHEELNTGKSSFAHGVPASKALVSKASSQRSPALPLQDAISNGVLSKP